ncbi:MAG: phosphoglycerate dehydrogenase [Gammaproteobacteria bacterium]|nr:phosphoglycerate dehydrogenase [Gammaproteobacteria bacterium]
MFKVFVADKLSEEGIAALKQYPELDIDFAAGLSVADAIPHAAEADAIIVRSATKIKGELLAAAKKVKVVGRAGIGVDNVDLEACTERGIVVLNTPDANATTTAELAIAHLFSLARGLPAADVSVRAGKWERNSMVGTEVSGKTVGIIGFGTIGRLFAERARGLKMRVIGFDPFVTEATFTEYGVEKVDLDQLVAEADFISLHCPVTNGTRGILSRERLAAMKKGARLINCARGGLVDEAALIELVTSGHLAGAALDVFDEEPPAKDSPLFGVPNIQFTPHLGASTHEAQTAVGIEIAHQIAAFLIRGEVVNSVNVPSMAPEMAAKLSPYMDLARKLGRLVCRMSEAPLTAVEIGVFGQAATLNTHPIASAAMVGMLCEHHAVPVNQINAIQLAKRQGIQVTETSSSDSRDYVSMVRIVARNGQQTLSIEGTLFDERHPRLVRVNDYEVETALEGHLLFTRHADQPGVVGALGDVLGREGINISRMQVGVAKGSDRAIAVLGVSRALEQKTLDALAAIAAIDKVMQVGF